MGNIFHKISKKSYVRTKVDGFGKSKAYSRVQCGWVGKKNVMILSVSTLWMTPIDAIEQSRLLNLYLFIVLALVVKFFIRVVPVCLCRTIQYYAHSTFLIRQSY